MPKNIRLYKTLCISALLCALSLFESLLWTASAGAADRALHRALALTPDAIEPYFDTILFVDKSEGQEFSQTMFVFERTGENTFGLFRRWRVSTGDARHNTPAGLYTLNPHRMYRMWYSRTYNGAPMPWAMFLDASFNGRATGLAIHGTDELSRLGTRASHGCVRVHPEHARELQQRIRSATAGSVPVFVYDRARNRTSARGIPQRDSAGNIVTKPGYRVLLIIDEGDALLTS
jgi:hypothetical protein